MRRPLRPERPAGALALLLALLAVTPAHAGLHPLWSAPLYDLAALEAGPKEQGTPTFLQGGARLVSADRTGTVRLFDATTGVELWKRKLGEAVVAQPVELAGGRVLLAGGDGHLRVVEAATGDDVWVESRPGQAGFHVAPLVHGPMVVALDAANAIAGRTVDGRFVFSFEEVPPPNELSLFGQSRPATDGRSIFVGLSDGTVASLSPVGRPRWQVSLPAESPRAADAQAGPVVVGGRLYVGSTQSGLAVLDAATGRREAWIQELGGLIHLRAADDGAVFAFSWRGEITRLVPREKGAPAVSWRVRVPGVPGPPALTSRGVLFCNGPGVMLLDRATGAMRDWRRFDRGCIGGVAVAPGLAAHIVDGGRLVVWKVLAEVG